MKNILKTLEVPIVTYVFLLLSLLCGYFKNVIFIFFIILFHELGHVLAIHLFHYKIIKVELYPFGGITKIDKPINSSINKEILIASAGVFFQALLFLFLFCFQNYLRPCDYELLQFYNLNIMLFNCIPIIPLDGSILMHALLEKFFSYEKALKYYQILSILFLCGFILLNIFFFENYFICVVLFWQFILLKKQEKYLIHRFYLERYLKYFPYQKIENEHHENYHVLKKNSRHFFYSEGKYKNEHEILAKLFDFPFNI